jgi:lysophospholipid acyltransferase (LPLAT)-like uncharacterized protein
VSQRAVPWWTGIAAWAGALLLLLLARTWRVSWRGPGMTPTRRYEQHCIFTLWHSRLLPLTLLHRGLGVAALISHHRDGELIARAIRHLGYVAGRGSSTRGGEEGAREMLRFAAEGRSLAITPDGPRGPAEELKAGVVVLGSHAGLPLLPVTASASAEWTFRSWDRFRVPKPFARVVVGYGDPVTVPRDLQDGELERWRTRLEDRLRALTREHDVGIGARS